MFHLHSRRLAVVAGAAAAGVAAGVAGMVIAAAAIPGPGGVINGCYSKVGGLVRIIDSGQSCSRYENPINWNQAGPQGSPGVSGYAHVASSPTPVDPNGFATVTVSCPAGKVALGGGYFLGGKDMQVFMSAPQEPTGAGWVIQVYNPLPSAFPAIVYATCATAG